MVESGEIREQFLKIVHPSRPNEWEVEEVVEALGQVDTHGRLVLLRSVEAIWPVSHSLCFTYLLAGADLLKQLGPEQIPEWVRCMLGIYEQKGLVGARAFMADVQRQFLAPLQGQASVDFSAIAPLMTKYIRGVSGRSLELQSALQPRTNTSIIFLPTSIDVFRDQGANFVFYKLLVSLQWAYVAMGSYEQMMAGGVELEKIIGSFPDSPLAADLFGVCLFRQAFCFLKDKLPGLVRQSLPLCLELVSDLDIPERTNPRQKQLRDVFVQALTEDIVGFDAVLSSEIAVTTALKRLYDVLGDKPGTLDLGACRLLLGEFDVHDAEKEIVQRRREQKDRFVALLAVARQSGEKQKLASDDAGGGRNERNDGLAAMLMLAAGKEPAESQRVSLANEEMEISPELRQIISDIVDDLGSLPASYVQAAQGIGGGAVNLAPVGSDREGAGFLPSEEVHIYDEWDFRRGGYRASWCRLTEKQLHPVRSNFVTDTLNKYHVQLVRLRRQFEMLRTHSCFVRRQRYGDDIDLDAVVDGLGDRLAGRAPSERMFVRLLRDRRDISTMFLVDMSNSTEGWVGVAVKEALILLTEALELVGDRYGIYGFSGMRRSRNDLYCIKDLDERYDERIQRRISAISPMEYTRMGPPIRHMTNKLLAIQSRVRLLIVLSDGKPEDYDDYKGEYAIEDTRKALGEARGRGIYPFCITIDKNAQDYLEHMFGSGNYIFVNEVAKLPHRLAEMYRLLTS